MSEIPKKVRKPNTRGVENKREKARANLAAGRAKRAQMLKDKREQEQQQQEYDVETDSDEDSSSDEDLVLTKKPKKKSGGGNETKGLHDEMKAMKEVLTKLVTMEKEKRKKPKKEKSTKIVVLQPNETKTTQGNTAVDAFHAKMKKIFN